MLSLIEAYAGPRHLETIRNAFDLHTLIRLTMRLPPVAGDLTPTYFQAINFASFRSLGDLRVQCCHGRLYDFGT